MAWASSGFSGSAPSRCPPSRRAGSKPSATSRGRAMSELWRAFGKHGKAMQARAAGLDQRPVVPDREEKSISAEETFDKDIRDAAVLERRLTALADRAAARLRAAGLLAGRVTVKIRRADFTTYTRQCVLEPPDAGHAPLCARPRSDCCGRGLPAAGMSHCDCSASARATCRPCASRICLPRVPRRDSRLDCAIDGIRDRFGSGVLTRASLLPRSSSGSGPRRG